MNQFLKKTGPDAGLGRLLKRSNGTVQV